MQPIAHIQTDFPQKFGIPRQSGIVPTLTGRIVFEPEFADADAVRGLEEFSHVWLIWQFEDINTAEWRPLVRPPRLGGEKKVGVFATRSPYRPNPIGLSCVELIRVEIDETLGPIIYVSGADLRDNTPIYDIKPYVALTDAHADARGGFIDTHAWQNLEVDCSSGLLHKVPEDKRAALLGVLAEDPRPAHDRQRNDDKVYKLGFAGLEIQFSVDNETHVLRVLNIQ